VLSEATPIVYNADGWVAMRYHFQNRLMVSCGPNTYVFAMQANISFAWVRPEDVPCCQAVTGGCCGQRRPNIIRYANESDARRWTNRGGR
jgi:hypothetical protein